MKWGERICCHTFTPTYRDDRYSLAGVHVLRSKSRFWPDPVALLQKNCLISCKLAWEKVSRNKEVLEIHSFFSLLYFSVILLNYVLILLRSLCLNHNVLLFLMTLQNYLLMKRKMIVAVKCTSWAVVIESQTSTGPIPLWYRSSVLPTEQSSQLGAGLFLDT